MTRNITMLQQGSGSSQGAAGGPPPAGRLEGRREDNREECWNWKSPEGCPRTTCQYSHPPGRGRMAAGAGQQDCVFWLGGSCKFTEAECRGKHNQAKFGTRPFRRRAGSAEGGRISPRAGAAGQATMWEGRQTPAWEGRQGWEGRRQQDFGRTQVTAPGLAVTGGMEAQQQLLHQLQLQQQQVLQQMMQQPGQLQLQQGGNYRC